MRRALLAVTSLLVLAGCGDDQAQSDRALDRVCDARADIARQTADLRGLTVADIGNGQARQSLQAIRQDLSDIRSAQADLSDERRAEVREAGETFTAALRSTASQLATGAGRDAAADQVRAATEQLSTTFRETYDRIDCPEG